MFNFLSLINNSVTIGFSYLLLIISAIISPKTINNLRFFPRSYWVSNKSFRQNALCLLFCVCQLNIDILFRKDLFPFNIICQYQADCLLSITVKNIIISPNFPVWKFCGKAKFPHSFGRFARNYAKTVTFHKISTPGNQVKLRYFSQCMFCFIFICITIKINHLYLLKSYVLHTSPTLVS